MVSPWQVKRETGAFDCKQCLCCPRNGKQVWVTSNATVASSHGKAVIKTCEPGDRPAQQTLKYRGVTVQTLAFNA